MMNKLIFSVALGLGLIAALPAVAQSTSSVSSAERKGSNTYTTEEVLTVGHRFFGETTRGLAKAVEYVFQRQGEPTAYIVGEEGAAAFVGGLRYGEGTLFTRNAGDRKVFWQGPSVGFDFGGEGSRTMMLVYGLPAVEALYQRFVGVDGSAYFIGGFGFTALAAEGVTVVPIRTGVGWRLGVNLGYLKFTPQATWNPF
jgi:hypothetical protein